MFVIFSLLAIRKSQVGSASLRSSQRKTFIFGSKFYFHIQFKILCLRYTEGFLITQVTDLRENFPSCEKPYNILFSIGLEGIKIALIFARTFRGRKYEIE